VAQAPSHWRERAMRLPRQLHPDRVAGPHLAAGDDDAHDARFTNQVAALVPAECGGHQTCLNAVQLGTRIAQTLHFDNSPTEMQPCTYRQTEEIDTARRDVLAHLPGRDCETTRSQFVVQFGVDQVNLAQIGLGRVARDPRAVLDGDPLVRVAFDSRARQRAKRCPGWVWPACAWRCG